MKWRRAAADGLEAQNVPDCDKVNKRVSRDYQQRVGGYRDGVVMLWLVYRIAPEQANQKLN